MAGPATTWMLGEGLELDLEAGALMGVLNVTPDSFSDGGLYTDPGIAVSHALDLVAGGAAIVDVGGESTRPGSTGVSEDDELSRVMPVVEGLIAKQVSVSIDTSKPGVAAAALQAGALVINDVNGFRDPAMTRVAAEHGCGVVVMHMQGTPRIMQDDPSYEDVVLEVESFLLARAAALEDAGVAPQRIAIDPGIGFGKALNDNLSILKHLERLASHSYPVVLGTSRKSFLGHLTSIHDPESRDGATAVTTALGFVRGARIFRVHDVVSSRHALQIASAIVASD
ncbi:MAG: dihydropteroate synthase [Acidimicrobiia bacterium]|nr:dihydropteroate synthase [Acidimicrobiia bacterium]